MSGTTNRHDRKEVEMACSDEDRIKTKVYGGGGTEPRNRGKVEKERIHGTKMSGGIHDGNNMDDNQSKGSDNEEMKLNHH